MMQNRILNVFCIVAAAIIAEAAALAPSTVGAPDEVRWGVGNWDPDTGLGNHRAVVMVGQEAAGARAVRVTVPWRRRDADPEKKDIIVVDAASGERVRNVFPLKVNREYGDIIFEASAAPGEYFFYYMPYRPEGRKNYPNVKYEGPTVTAEPAWLKALGLEAGLSAVATAVVGKLPRARTVEIQACDEFSAFHPMEVIATAAETGRLLERFPEPFLIFPEDRRYSIRMSDDLPRRWAETGPRSSFKGEAARGEFFTFQLGLWAAAADAANVSVDFSDLVLAPRAGKDRFAEGKSRFRIPTSRLTCFNTGGVGWDGEPFTKDVSVVRGKVQALWCGVDVPADLRPGVYEGDVTIRAAGLPERKVRLSLEVGPEKAIASGDDDPYGMTRLRWLNSRLAFDDEVVKPFTPLRAAGRAITCLGRSLELAATGLPARVTSTFTEEMTSAGGPPVEVLAGPFELLAADPSGQPLTWKTAPAGPTFVKRAPGRVAWETLNTADGLEMRLRAAMEFDGFVEYRVELRALRDLELADIRLEVPLKPAAARYMMGLGFKGGRRPGSFDWAWDVKKNQDALWIGAVNAGLQVQLRAENYSRPLNTNFYLSKPLNLPPSWHNGGKGGVSVREEGAGATAAVAVKAFSGPRRMKAGDTLRFDFNLLLTPFKPLDPGKHFRERYFHAFKPLDEVAAAGANVINVHHATEINPYINYPFLRPDKMKAYIDEAHRRGLKVKIYNTIRELSTRAPELFALRNLGHEVFTPGPGGGYSWLQEHLGGDYIAAWFVPELKDSAVINSGMSRWHNYYVEGLDWLARNIGIDGLYIDDVAFDRTTMKRVRRVLERRRPEPLIDLHSANQYNPRDGFASSANLYLEHFPYLDRLWFGEYFDYNASGPDYWLVEVSGIPFGLMGEMLEKGGNPWRGMVFGMTSRLPWAGDPRPLWELWDAFGIGDSRMVGWWADSNPVRTGRDDVLATVFLKPGAGRRAEPKGSEAGPAAAQGRSAEKAAVASKPGRATALKETVSGAALIGLASWAPAPVDVKLTIDWKKLGLDPERAVLYAPAVRDFQDEARFKPGEPVPVQPGKGVVLIVTSRGGR